MTNSRFVRLQLEELEERTLLSVGFTGVAAADPTSDSAIFWTLALDSAEPAPVLLTAEVSTDPSVSDIGLLADYSGRTMLWTPAQDAVWARMRAENHPWALTVFEAANATGTPDEWYNDYGQWAAFAYRISGDAAYARKAVPNVQATLETLTLYSNEVREYGFELPVLVSWLLPAMTTTEKDAAFAELRRLCEGTLAEGFVRFGDSDQTVGEYFMLATSDLLMGSNYLAGTITAGGYETGKPVGGWIATAADRATARNAVAEYVAFAKGGVWIESSEYNIGTVPLLLLGAEATRTALGVDHFPEITALAKELAAQAPWDFTADLKLPYQWGDVQDARAFPGFHAVPYLAILAGLNPADPWLAARVKQLAADPQWWNISRGLYLYNPYAESIPTPTPAGGRFAAGMGQLRWRTETELFGAHLQPTIGVDHEVAPFGSFQLFSGGEWAITHPIGYAGVTYSPSGHNTVSLSGLGPMQSRRVLAHGIGADYSYVSGRNEGPFYPEGTSGERTTFLRRWDRSVVYLDPNVIVVRDDIDMDDPRLTPIDGYSDDEQLLIESAPALLQWIVHCATPPTVDVSTGTVTWRTEAGQLVTARVLSPAAPVITIYDETLLWGALADSGPDPSEMRFQARIESNATRETFVVVLSVGEPPAATLNADGSVRVGTKTLRFATDGSVTVNGGAP